jgi:hypothetical protein
MKWKFFEKDKVIAWKPLPVSKTGGRTVPVSSYDVAVVLPDRVVVFRNQSLMVGESHEEVEKQARFYIDQKLKLKIKLIDEAVSVRKQDKEYVGTLLYSTLAEEVTAAQVRPDNDLEVYGPAEFLERVKKEGGESK